MKKKFFEAAKSAAMASEGTGRRNSFRHGAVLVKKNKVVASGYNSYKTHPLPGKYSEFPYLHAESKAIIRKGLDNCEDLVMYVVRIDKKGNYLMSKPCEVCQKIIAEALISTVYYTNEYGKFERL